MIMTTIILLMAFSTVILITIALIVFIRERTETLLKSRQESDSRELQDLFIEDINAREVLVFSITGGIIAIIFTLFITSNLVLALGLGIGFLFLPRMVFSYLRAVRLDQFQEQLPAAMDQLAASAKAGLSLAQAMDEVAKNATPPLSQEFSLIMQDYRLGTDLAIAISSARSRLQCRTFGLVATALLVNREKGGNLPEALETLSNSLKEIWRLEQKLITASAEGRKAIKVIAAIPFFIYLMVIVMQPELTAALTASIAGMAILVLAVVMYVLALLWLRKTLQIEI